MEKKEKKKRAGKIKNINIKKRKNIEGSKPRHHHTTTTTTPEQSTDSGCAAFFSPSNIKDYKYARNVIQKAKRISSSYSQLKKKQEKAEKVFINGTAFFKKCPEGKDIYEQLRYQIRSVFEN